MKIKSLYREGKSYGEIADIVDLSILEVMEYLQQIKSNKSTGTVINDRKTMVKELYEEGKTLEEIANNLNISVALVKEDLLSSGIIQRRVKGKEERSQDKQESKVEKRVKEKVVNTPKSHILGIKERRENVEKLYGEGMEEEEIADMLGIPVRVVRRDIEALLDYRMIQSQSAKAEMDVNVKKEREEEQVRVLKRREQIERLYKEGRTVEKIVEELGISRKIVIDDIEILIREGKLPKENGKELSEDKKERIVNRRRKMIDERRRKVAELYNDGKTSEEIAIELGISVWTVKNDINILVERKIIERRTDKQLKKESEGDEVGKENDEERRKKIIAERREQIIALYNEETSISQMARMFGVRTTTIKDDINFLLKEGKISNKKEKGVRSKKEEIYYNGMIRSIKLLIQNGEFNNVVEYIKMLKSEVKLTKSEKEKLDKLLELIIVRLRSRQ